MSSSSSLAYPSIFTTPSTKKYSVRNAEYSYFYAPSTKSDVHSEKPLTVYVERESRLEMEWVRHSQSTALLYALVALLTTAYYAGCFLFQYGNYLPRSRGNIFDEPFLTRTVVVQWLVLLVVLVTGAYLYRRLFMPLYIFLAVLATNGTLVLFILRVKQLVDGRITILNIPLNMLGVLLFCAVLHNIVYFYAMHLKLIETRQFVTSTLRAKTLPNAYSSIHGIPEKSAADFIDIV